MKFLVTSIIAVVWIVSLAFAFFAGRITNADQRLPEEFDKFRQLYGAASDSSGMKWLSDPRCRVFGPFVVMRAKDRKIPGLYAAFKSNQPFPTVMILPDGSSSDQIGQIELRDKAGNSVSVVNKDGVFNFLFLQTGDTLRVDKGLTGIWGGTKSRVPNAQ